MKIKAFLTSILATCLFFVSAFLIVGTASAAPRLYFNPATSSPQKGSDINVDILIDVGTESAFGADALIALPPEITVKSVTGGGFFSDFSNTPVNSGLLTLHGFFSAAYGSKTGSGKFASLVLTSSKDLGSSILLFVCTTGFGNTFILNSAGANIMSCSSANRLTLTYPNPAPTPTPGSNSDNSGNAPTNACGGTCGSNYNCNSGLYCYQGFCRNPDCVSSVTCGACSTPTPTTKATARATAKATAKPTPEIVTLAKTTPYPTPKPSAIPEVTPIAEAQSGRNFLPLIIWSALGLVAVVVIIIAINSLSKKKNPPQITPPTTFPMSTPPGPQTF